MLVKANRKSKVCLNCKNKALWRGVCLSCYSLAKRQIKAKENTDDQLVKAGFWLVAQKGPRGPRIVELRRKVAAALSVLANSK